MGARADVTTIEHGMVIHRALVLADQLDIAAWHWPDSRLVSRGGWPDLTFAAYRAGKVKFMYREVKTGMASRTPVQTQTGYLMIAAGYDYAVWHWYDIDNGRIETDLRALAG